MHRKNKTAKLDKDFFSPLMFRKYEADTGKAIKYVARSPVGHFLLDPCFLEGLNSLTLIVNFNFCCVFSFFLI